MRIIVLLLISCLFAISSCRKDDSIPVEEVHPSSYWIEEHFVGDWTLSAEAYHNGYYDSLIVFKAPKLYLRLTDSIVDDLGGRRRAK